MHELPGEEKQRGANSDQEERKNRKQSSVKCSDTLREGDGPRIGEQKKAADAHQQPRKNTCLKKKGGGENKFGAEGGLHVVSVSILKEGFLTRPGKENSERGGTTEATCPAE